MTKFELKKEWSCLFLSLSWVANSLFNEHFENDRWDLVGISLGFRWERLEKSLGVFGNAGSAGNVWERGGNSLEKPSFKKILKKFILLMMKKIYVHKNLE